MDLITTSARFFQKKRAPEETPASLYRGTPLSVPCPVCVEVFKYMLTERSRNDWGKFGTDLRKKDKKKPWHRRDEYAERSRPCEICRMFREAIKEDHYDFLGPETPPVPYGGFHLRQLMVEGDGTLAEDGRMFHYMTLQLISGVFGLFRLVLLSGDAPILIGREIEEEVDLSIASRWITDCQRSHPECGDAEPVELPSRLIDVGGEDPQQEPRLVNTAGSKGVFVALSHCWGTEKPLVTDRANLDAHLERIELVRMPKTYRDAVTITRQLGFRYLWIDSLCIIQGDSEDWHFECVHMDDTFANAALTIAAQDASDATMGILHKREAEVKDSCQFSIHPDGAEPELVLRLEKAGMSALAGGSSNFEPEIPSVLDKRAWALQELLVSRRVLQFRAKQMSFICNRHRCSESLHHPIKYNNRLPHEYSLRETSIPKNILSAVPEQDVYKIWRHLVVNHSRRYLTFESDKLPSISAIAKRLHERSGDIYLAGLWKGQLKQQITWYLNTNREKRGRVPSQSKSLPSWTWASTDYPVENWWDEGIYTNIEYNIDIVGATITQLGHTAFGNVSSGTLRISGAVIRVMATPPAPSDFRSIRYRFTGIEDEGLQFFAALHLDKPRDLSVEGQTEMTLLFLGTYPDMFKDELEDQVQFYRSVKGWSALALEKVKGENDAWRRIGLVTLEHFMTFTESEEEVKREVEELRENTRFVRMMMERERRVVRIV